VHAVIHVVPIAGVIDIYVVGFVPRRRPRFRPRINERHPIAVVLKARIPAYEDHRQAADAEEVIAPEVASEAVFGNPVAVIAAALTSSTVVVIPRTGARLDETAAHLPLVLRDTAGVDTAMGGLSGPDATVISAAPVLLRFLSWLLLWLSLRLRWFVSLLLMLLLRGLRFAVLLTLLLVLCEDRGSGSEKQEQNCYADKASLFHFIVFLLSARYPLTLSPSPSCLSRYDFWGLSQKALILPASTGRQGSVR